MFPIFFREIEFLPERFHALHQELETLRVSHGLGLVYPTASKASTPTLIQVDPKFVRFVSNEEYFDVTRHEKHELPLMAASSFGISGHRDFVQSEFRAVVISFSALSGVVGGANLYEIRDGRASKWNNLSFQ